MRETYLAGWKAAAAAGMQGLMCSSNAVNGIPLCAHADLLNSIMRKEFGMSGAVISDGNGVTDIYHQPDASGNNPINGKGIPGHEYAKSYPAAAADAINAGCDMSWDEDLPPFVRMGNPLNGTVKKALQLNLTTMATVRRAASHTLLPRFRVGLFDNHNPNTTVKNPWVDIPASIILSDAHTALAKQAAAESMALLRCDPGVLPVLTVSAGGPKIIAVVGAAASNAQSSIDRYNGHPDPAHISTFVQGVGARAKLAGARVVTCINASLASSAAACAAHLRRQGAELVLLVLGGHTEGEQHDRSDLGLNTGDLALLKSVHAALPSAAAVPKVLAVVAGGAVSTEQAEPMVSASIWAGKGGMQAGAGFASLLYGDVDFSARVAATVYKEAWVNASDMMDSAISGGVQPRGYRYMSAAATQKFVQYPFGHGLSLHTYRASFSQQHYTISSAALAAGSNVTIGITVTAAANRSIAGMQKIHSVLMFLSDDQGQGQGQGQGLPRRKMWLADFVKVRSFSGVTGTTASATLTLGQEAVSRWIPGHGREHERKRRHGQGTSTPESFTAGAYVVQKGNFTLTLTDGTSAATLTVT